MQLKPSTAPATGRRSNLYLKPTIGAERVQQTRPSRLSVVWRQLYEAGGKDGKPVSRRSVEFARAVLNKCANDAVVERNQRQPGDRVQAAGSTPPDRPARGDVPRRRAGTRLGPLWKLLGGTGTRRGEG
jgi:integrase